MPELPESLSFAALVAAVLEYAIMIRHREQRRCDARSDELIAETALQGLVRVVLIDDQLGRRVPRMRPPLAGTLRRWSGRPLARSNKGQRPSQRVV
jgi:hypothetical protein